MGEGQVGEVNQKKSKSQTKQKNLKKISRHLHDVGEGQVGEVNVVRLS